MSGPGLSLLSAGSSGAASALTVIEAKSGAAASYDFQGIAGTFSALRMVFTVRTDGAGNNVSLRMRFNNDSTAGTYVTAARQFYSAWSDVSDSANDYGSLGFLPGAAASSNKCTSGTVDIPNYANATFRKIAVSSSRGSADAGFAFLGGFEWNNAAAITRVTLYPASGSFTAACSATLYGVT